MKCWLGNTYSYPMIVHTFHHRWLNHTMKYKNVDNGKFVIRMPTLSIIIITTVSIYISNSSHSHPGLLPVDICVALQHMSVYTLVTFHTVLQAYPSRHLCSITAHVSIHISNISHSPPGLPPVDICVALQHMSVYTLVTVHTVLQAYSQSISV